MNGKVQKSLESTRLMACNWTVTKMSRLLLELRDLNSSLVIPDVVAGAIDPKDMEKALHTMSVSIDSLRTAVLQQKEKEA